MFCVNCGTPLPDDANFCFKCGCDLGNLAQSSGICRSATHALRVGEYITFGRYPQNSSSYKDPIEWLVLEVNDKYALLLSRYVLVFESYSRNYGVTWENCDLRKWLNDEFYNSAFSDAEQRRIRVSVLNNDDNHKYHTKGGNRTNDKVFCLNIAEANKYFRNDSDRKCECVELIKQKYTPSEQWLHDADGSVQWWLRSPGEDQYEVAFVTKSIWLVNTDGRFPLRKMGFREGGQICLDGIDLLMRLGVRPAIWITL